MKIGGYLKETSYPACHQPEGQHSSSSFTTRHPFTKLIGLFVTAFFPEEEDACHKINYGYIEVPFSQFSCMMCLLREFGQPLCILAQILSEGRFASPRYFGKFGVKSFDPYFYTFFYS